MGDANAGEGVQVGNVLSSEEQRLDGSGENNMENAKEKIEEFDWDGLEERFWGKMEECRRVEERIMGEFGELIEVRLSLFHRHFCGSVSPSCMGGGLRGGSGQLARG